MIRQICSAPEQGRLSPSELVITEKFNYTPLDADVAQQVQKAAQRIRRFVQRTLQDLIAVGKELLAVKAALPHGSFVPWLRAEFGWAERTARNFMTVAARLGSKTAIIADLRIEPTAAYLLTAPSAPEEAVVEAIQRAESGERITASVAKEILGSLRQKAVRREKELLPALPSQKLLGELLASLESFRRRWERERLSVLARELREYADFLERRNGRA